MRSCVSYALTMALDLDPTRAPRRPTELRELVAAVVAATPEDEQDWLEWKSHLDLGRGQGRFALAKAILGMANRDVRNAHRAVEGFGYVVVGASAGESQGLPPIDTARLDDALVPYLGADGPRWSAHRVGSDAGEVLVVIVDPPRPGNPLFPLRKDFFDGRKGEGAAAGTVFVRSGTKTRPATAADIDMLNRRVAVGPPVEAEGPDIAVSAISSGLPVFSEDAFRAIIDGAVDARTDTFVREGLTRSGGQPTTTLGRTLRSIDGHPAYRSWDEFSERAREWKTELLEFGWDLCLWLLTNSRAGMLALEVSNQSVSNLSSVEIVLKLPNEPPLELFDEEGAEKPEPPETPAQFDSNVPRGVGATSWPPPIYFPPPVHSSVAIRHGVYLGEAGGSPTLTFVAGDLRPSQTIVTEAAFVIPLRPLEAPLNVQWTATSTGLNGVRSGELLLEVGPVIQEEMLEKEILDRL